jgi:hypothetical protein
MTKIKMSKDEVLAELKAKEFLNASPLEECYVLLLMQVGEFKGWWIPGPGPMSLDKAIACVAKMRVENGGSTSDTIISNLRFSYDRTFN